MFALSVSSNVTIESIGICAHCPQVFLRALMEVEPRTNVGTLFFMVEKTMILRAFITFQSGKTAAGEVALFAVGTNPDVSDGTVVPNNPDGY